MAGEFRDGGAKVPHDLEGELEHRRDLQDEAKRAHRRKEATGREPRRWAFWRRTRPPTR